MKSGPSGTRAFTGGGDAEAVSRKPGAFADADPGQEPVIPLADLYADLASRKMFRALGVGFLMAAVVVIHCLALGAIVFNGPLLPYAVHGAGMMMLGAIAFCAVIGVASSHRGMLAYPQEIPATVLGSLSGAVVASAGHGEAAFLTMAMLLVVSSLLTGALFLAIGRCRLANFFRFIPYPVAGGFFAGTGCVLVLMSFSVMTGASLDWPDLPGVLLDPAMAWKWAPGAAFGLALIVAMSRAGSFLTVMGSVVVLSLLFHLGLWVMGVSVEDARAQGLLLSGLPHGSVAWPVFGPGDLGGVNWGAVMSFFPDLLAAVLVTLLCLVVYVNGLEVATGDEADLDREFRVAGVASVISGLGGSVPGCQSFVLTLPSKRLGADTPWTGIVVALTLGLSLLLGGRMLEMLPLPVIGGVLFFIGGDLVNTWLVQIRRRLGWADHALIALIAAMIAVFGFLEGVGAGMFATLALFAFRLGREDVVVEEFTGRRRNSTRVRSVPDRALLLDRGELLRGYRLRGYLFFGSAHRLVDHLKLPMREDPRPLCIVLDFAEVSGCDLSALTCLCQFARSARSAGAQVVVCGASSQVEAGLRDSLDPAERDVFRFEPDLDHGLERSEDAILEIAVGELSHGAGHARGSLLMRVAPALEERLDEQVAFEELVEQLEPWLEPREYEPGEEISLRGELQDGMHLLVSGQATVHDGDGRRLYQCGPGDVLEPWAAFREHAAASTAVARSRCRTMLLAPTKRELLESDDMALTVRLFAFLLRTRSSRIALFPPAGTEPGPHEAADVGRLAS